MLRTDIGENDAALQCTTDSTTCCSNSCSEIRAGDFYFPDDQLVPILVLSLMVTTETDTPSQFISIVSQVGL